MGMTACIFRTNNIHFVQAEAVHREKEDIVGLEYILLVFWCKLFESFKINDKVKQPNWNFKIN